MNKLVAYMELSTLASSTSASSRHWGRAFLPFADCSPAPLFSSNMGEFGRRWRGSNRAAEMASRSRRMLLEAGMVFLIALGATLYVLAPKAPGRAEVNTFVENRTTDQHFSGCDEARAAGREDIPRWDPSYREHMDGDGDGLACEPIRY